MFPGQQGATCPAQLWPPRLGIANFWRGRQVRKSAAQRGLVLDGITKNRCSQASFCTVGGKRQSGHINPATPVHSVCSRGAQRVLRYGDREYVMLHLIFIYLMPGEGQPAAYAAS